MAGTETGKANASFDRVALPVQVEASDAPDLVREAAFHLSTRYGREYEHAMETTRLMLERQLDEIEVRRETSDSSGLIEWQLGNEAVASTRGLLSAAARAAAAPRKRFVNAESVISEEFLAHCYMGQTKVGSYVVTALTPAAAMLPTSRSKDASQRHPRIKGRDVTRTLIESLHAVRDAVVESRGDNGGIEVFELAVSAGVSFELLDALVPLTRGSEASIEVAYVSQDSDEVGSEGGPVQVSFTPDDGRILESAREYFMKTPEPVVARLTGEVTNLKNSSSGAEHLIKLATRVNGNPKVITVELRPEQYGFAVEAHAGGRLFTVQGELEVRQRGAYVRSPEIVKVEEARVSDSATVSSRVVKNNPALFE